MQKIDREKFFDSWHSSYGRTTQATVDGLETLLTFLEADDKIQDLRHAAYMLATVRRECGVNFKPVREVSRGRGLAYGKVDPLTKQAYYGRGYVQLTWKANYQTFKKILDVELVTNPDLALDPTIAYRIMSYGMRNGSFTGVGLERYIKGNRCDYVNARRIINGTDVAELVAGYAQELEKALRAGA